MALTNREQSGLFNLNLQGVVFPLVRTLLALIGSGLIVAFVAWSAVALVPACGVGGRIAGTWIDWCPFNKVAEAEDWLAALHNQNRALTDSILRRERELALLNCAPESQQQVPSTELTPQPEAIDHEDWEDRRIGLLEGCWELDSLFSTTDQTGAETRYSQWTMCFSADGAGSEEMLADNGASCSGFVRGFFDGDGSLIIEELDDLHCSDGGYIYRLISNCKLNELGTANCVVTQPEIGSSGNVEFRRSARGN